ncbi:hypothetical protein [Pseudomonas sp. GGS8]|uniref:hypothetical protein n=1 Tax=Pseudomonas sp. GGS8 TaxID=2817892 RepID=UPI00345F481B
MADGNDLTEINAALQAAREQIARPSLILVRTHIGDGSPEQDTFKAHGSPLGVDDVRKTKESLFQRARCPRSLIRKDVIPGTLTVSAERLQDWD